MAKFFIDRPIFAWVIALFIMVMGGVAITQLPVAQYPPVAPPSIVINTAYPGASAQTLEDSVLSVIEREMNGSPGLIYMEATAQANGTGSITLSFAPGTNADLAQVDVQNRLSRAAPRLPAAVNQQGVRVDKSNSNFLLFTMLASTNPGTDPVALGDYASRNVVPELQRLPGIGQVQLFGTERAMRIWIDPAKMVSFNVSAAEVTAAIRSQNAQVSSGTIGELPNIKGQAITATVVVDGQLSSVEQFSNIVLRANSDGSTVRIKDVARVELGGQAYSTLARLNGQPAVGIGVQLSPGGNALDAAKAVRQRMDELSRFFPEGMTWSIPYDSSGFVSISIKQVAETLVEAVALVFLVMFLFLQNWRYTIIPTIVVPIALLGTFATLLALGLSINVLTMFGMVLVIGIVVDDAIVVVENVERIMTEEGLSPIEATRKAMRQISGAIIGVTVVLISVFVPLAFFAGSIGNIYRQFAVVMVAAIGFSAFLALSLTPALCATLLKPMEAGEHHEKKGFFGWFNRKFSRTAKGYEGMVARMLKRAARYLVIYGAIVGAVAVVYMRLPTSFLPSEDQGNIIVNVQLPPGATLDRTQSVMAQVEDFILKQPEVESMVGVLGFSFSGQGQNAALAFVTLKDWSERTGPGQSAQDLAGRAFGALSGIRDAFIFPLSPPPIRELGNASGFTFRLQDRGGAGHTALVNARNQLLGMASQSKVLSQVRPEGLEDAPQLQIDIDRDKANALGVPFDAINTALSTSLGSSYVNDFPNQGRLQRVVVQADAPARMQPDDLLQLNVINSQGKAVPLSAFATTRWVLGAQQTVRYNGYPAMRISGAPA
ncbi:MAG: efflux RND transporter permease subunit, partial [Burkholderiaceae bacterium]|nr:efflux RND transporter permease subunit [Burkholderiaceae bacterium]